MSFCCHNCLLTRILFLSRYIEAQCENLIITTIIKTTNYRRISKNNLKNLEIQKLRNTKKRV